MILYFDTSAVISLLVEEPGSATAARAWDGADRVAAVPLLYVEARAALAQARRLGRLTSRGLRVATTGLDDLFAQLVKPRLDAPLIHRAGELAEARSLRGYDAVHLAGALTFGRGSTAVVSGDGALLDAARAEGLAVVPTGG